jgi:DNA-binding PadR family transcriptional regulator
VSRTVLYITFDRLESKQYLQSELRPGPAVRRGKLRRYITVTPIGLQALRNSRAVLSNM